MKYFNRLLKLAYYKNVYVQIVNRIGAAYCPTDNKIILPIKNRSIEDLTLALAHELGHSYQIYTDEIYKYMHDFYISRKPLIDIINIEIDAWDTAYKILKNIGYTNWDFYYRSRDYSLWQYSEYYKTLYNKRLLRKGI